MCKLVPETVRDCFTAMKAKAAGHVNVRNAKTRNAFAYKTLNCLNNCSIVVTRRL